MSRTEEQLMTSTDYEPVYEPSEPFWHQLPSNLTVTPKSPDQRVNRTGDKHLWRQSMKQNQPQPELPSLPMSSYSKPMEHDSADYSTSRSLPLFTHTPKNLVQRTGNQLVDVYVGSTFVRSISFSTLVQFSRAARESFDGPHGKLGDVAVKLPKAPIKRSAADVEALIETMKALSNPKFTKKGENIPRRDSVHQASDRAGPLVEVGNTPQETTALTGVRPNEEQVHSPATHQNQSLYLSLPPFSIDRSQTGLLYCLNWMDIAITTHLDPENPFRCLPVPKSRLYTLSTLIKIYSAALHLDLEPELDNIQLEIMQRLSVRPPTAWHIELVWRLLPHDDIIVGTALKTCTFFAYRHRYTEAADRNINAYVAKHEELAERFLQIEANAVAYGIIPMERKNSKIEDSETNDSETEDGESEDGEGDDNASEDEAEDEE